MRLRTMSGDLIGMHIGRRLDFKDSRGIDSPELNFWRLTTPLRNLI